MGYAIIDLITSVNLQIECPLFELKNNFKERSHFPIRKLEINEILGVQSLLDDIKNERDWLLCSAVTLV